MVFAKIAQLLVLAAVASLAVSDASSLKSLPRVHPGVHRTLRQQGTVNLIAKPGLTFDQVRDALTKGVDTAGLKSTGYTCGGTSDTTFPNNQYGYGRVNAAKVVGSTPVPPSPTTPAPTTPTTPKPTTAKPVTPKPTTAKPVTPKPTQPSGCEGLSYSECEDAPDCYWSWWYGQCRPF
ncbi:hypothetical protein ATCC90586_001818 [Pythium insidiosum]|nr:hypothetical protein ATCC90586_001818 [Pythium insidiosum]